MLRGGGQGPAKKYWSTFKEICHLGVYFWSTSGYLKALEYRGNVQMPYRFQEATIIKVYAALSHIAKCCDLRTKELLNCLNLMGLVQPIWAMPIFELLFLRNGFLYLGVSNPGATTRAGVLVPPSHSVSLPPLSGKFAPPYSMGNPGMEGQPPTGAPLSERKSRIELS